MVRVILRVLFISVFIFMFKIRSDAVELEMVVLFILLRMDAWMLEKVLLPKTKVVTNKSL